MIPTFEVHVKVIEEIIPQLHKDIQSYISSGKSLVGDIFRRPIKTPTGFSTGDGSPQDTVIDWSRSLEQIYGKSFENCSFFESLVKHLSPFYLEVKHPPPRWSSGTDIKHEAKIFLSDILFSSSTVKATYELPPANTVAELTYDFLTRAEDEYTVEAPLLGIEIGDQLKFKYGTLTPIDLDKRIDFMRDRSLGVSRYRGNFHADWAILDAKTVLEVKFKLQRSDATTLMMPPQLQALADNVLQLMRIFSYGGTQYCFQSYYLTGVGRRSCGVMSPGNDLPHRKPIRLDESGQLVDFLNKHTSEKRIEENHDLSFVLNRMAETWGRSRSDEFQVFDYVAILEALLVPNSEPETAFKVSLYSAHLIASNAEERSQIFDLARKAYKIRNAIAHCKSEIKEKERLTSEEMQKFGSVVHKIIRAAFDVGVEKVRADAKTLILR